MVTPVFASGACKASYEALTRSYQSLLLIGITHEVAAWFLTAELQLQLQSSWGSLCCRKAELGTLDPALPAHLSGTCPAAGDQP